MAETTQVPEIELNDGVLIPQLGFGVFQIPPEETVEAVTNALDVGYRHIDTAAAYENEAEVGQAINASGLDRDELFVTTKCFNDRHGFNEAKDAFKESLDRLELDYIDLYLIHWPVPVHDKFVETWKAFIELKEEGVVRSIGVSNFQPEHLRRLIDETGVTPSVNQVELHPRFQQQGLRREHDDRGIVTEAWSPLAQGGQILDEWEQLESVLEDPAIVPIAEEHGKTPAQVVLRWHIQVGNVIFPKSTTPGRIAENFDIFDFHLSDEQMGAIEELDAGARMGPEPETFVMP